MSRLGGDNNRALSTKYRYHLLLIALLILSLSLRIIDFNRDLWLDEYRYATLTSLNSFGALWKWLAPQLISPLYLLMMLGWDRLFGDSEIAIRLPSLIFALGAILILFRLTTHVSGPKSALLAALLLCFSPVHIWYSREATFYAFLTFLILLAVWALLRMDDIPAHKGWALGYMLAIVFVCFTHWFTLPILGVLFFWAWFQCPKIKWRTLWMNGALAILVLLWLAWKSRSGELFVFREHLRPFNLLEWWMLFFNYFAVGNSLWNLNPYLVGFRTLWDHPGLIVIQIFLFSIFVLGLARPPQEGFKKKGWSLVIVALFSLPGTLFVLSLLGYRDLYIERYAVCLLPFFLMVLSHGTMSIRGRGKWVILCLIVFLSLASLFQFFEKDKQWTVYKPNPPWRRVARHFLLDRRAAADPLVILGTTSLEPLKYYDSYLTPHFPRSRETLGNFRICGPENKDAVRALEPNSLAMAGVQYFYFVQDRSWQGEFRTVMDMIVEDERFMFERMVDIDVFTIYKFNVIPEGQRSAKIPK